MKYVWRLPGYSSVFQIVVASCCRAAENNDSKKYHPGNMASGLNYGVVNKQCGLIKIQS
jgi:hypothetical protein